MVNFENGKTPINDTNLNLMQAELKIEILQLSFPIGSRYITESADTNPNSILGFGTWERFKGLVALGVDEDDEDLNEVGKTGGEKKHTMTIDEMVKHSHQIPYNDNTFGAGDYPANTVSSASLATTKEWASDNGSGQPFNIMQPFEVVGYMWIRRA